MPVSIKDVHSLKDLPKQCDICGESRYGDCHTNHGAYKVVERLFLCGRRAVYYLYKDVHHWNQFYELCREATRIVENYHAAELRASLPPDWREETDNE